MTKLKITVTKEILERSMYCGEGMASSDKKLYNHIRTNCAIALAVRDIWPKAHVDTCVIYPFGREAISSMISLPEEAEEFIEKFDEYVPEARAAMEPLEFEVNVPAYVIRKINIDELRPLLENHPTLAIIS